MASTGAAPFAFLATAVLAAVGFSFFAAWAPGSKNAVAQSATAMNRKAGKNRWLETRRRRASGINKSPAATNKDRSVSKSKKARNISYLHPLLQSNSKECLKT
ncbi:hypothetical protein VLK31_10930 [Variovorax sp. H27-G14]|uniref:hypothetical protein n=1 Tax=Variovorax sp. H27-G14 TaxID=3111914 RepID=UPI0038FCA065